MATTGDVRVRDVSGRDVSVRDVSVREVSAAAARRFLALRQFLAPPRALPAEPASVLAIVDRLGSIQFDPLLVAGRNHDLVLHARIDGYDPAWTEELLYVRRLLFEAKNKGLSLLPTRELPWYRATWDRAAAYYEGGTFVEHREVVDTLVERIRATGPVRAIDLDRDGAIDWHWGPTSRGRALLEALAEAGILGLARREGNRRVYDLVERLYPPDLLVRRVEPREQLLHKLLSRYRAHGLLGAGGPGELWYGIGPAPLPDGTRAPGPGRAELLAELVERGDLAPVRVEGLPRVRYVVTGELSLLAQAEGQAERAVARSDLAVSGPAGAVATPGVAFVAPLDPLAWDRDLLRQLYGFDYVWEVYVPAAARRWGYYVLPILYGDRLVGRLEPRIDREGRAIRILRIWWENGFDPLEAPGFVAAFARALDAYRRFGRARRIAWPGARRELALARAVREASAARM